MNREWLARAPLPLLALSAAWGVWQFQMQFTPWFVALLSALAFEAVYVSLALVPTSDPRRATVISISAVAVSVIYNTLSSLFHLRPALLDNRTLVMDGALALLHGAPLAIVAYAVADLLLHVRHPGNPHVVSLQTELAATRQALDIANQQGVSLTQVNVNVSTDEVDDRRQRVKLLVESGQSVTSAARQVGVSRQTATKWLKG